MGYSKISYQNNGVERQANLRLNTLQLTKGEQKTLIILIATFHFVGLVGFLIPGLYSLFLDLVPFHLMLILVFIAGSHRPASGNFFLFTAIIFILAFTLEWVGVHKGWLFGSYTYGPTLGVQLDGIPLCISVNWFLLIYSTGVFMRISRVRNIFVRVLIGAFILVLLDVLIEPVAVQFNYWNWADNIIPYKNYISWFFVSAIMLLIFEVFQFKKQSIVAPVFLVVQFVFFIVLRLI